MKRPKLGRDVQAKDQQKIMKFAKKHVSLLSNIRRASLFWFALKCMHLCLKSADGSYFRKYFSFQRQQLDFRMRKKVKMFGIRTKTHRKSPIQIVWNSWNFRFRVDKLCFRYNFHEFEIGRDRKTVKFTEKCVLLKSIYRGWNELWVISKRRYLTMLSKNHFFSVF